MVLRIPMQGVYTVGRAVRSVHTQASTTILSTTISLTIVELAGICLSTLEIRISRNSFIRCLGHITAPRLLLLLLLLLMLLLLLLLLFHYLLLFHGQSNSLLLHCLLLHFLLFHFLLLSYSTLIHELLL